MSKHRSAGLSAVLQWTAVGRFMVFMLAAASIWCLLAEFYGLCSMHTFTWLVFLPATFLLFILAVMDRFRGSRALWHAVLIGTLAGLIAAIAYDVFRLPFVFAREWGGTSVVPAMNLFKVFPRFGAMILGQPLDQPHYSLSAHLVGWAYHFSNGITFGIMYVAMLGNPRTGTWGWAVVMAVGLELAMLFTPYPAFFGIPLTKTFVAVTLAAHIIFGIVMGVVAKTLATRSRYSAWNGAANAAAPS